MFVNVSSAHSFVEAGSLRALAVAAKARSPLCPDLPTIDETAAKGLDLLSWTGLLAPAGTPQPILDKLSAEVSTVLAMPEARDGVGKWTRLAESAGIEPE